MPSFITQKGAENIALSLTILIVMLACRFAAECLAARKGDLVARRRRRFTIRAVAHTLIAVALLGIWMSEIQSVLFSLTAVMVALVVATKELLMCGAGAVLRVGGRLFKVGDRIEMNGLHGEVVDHGLFSTTIMELPPQGFGHAATGRRITLPNSMLLAGPVRVEAQPRHFAPHRFTITLEHPVAVGPALARLEAAAEAALAPDLERAARFHRMTGAKLGVEVAGPGHEVTLGTNDIGKLQFTVTLYCLVQDAAAMQRAVTLAFLSDAAALAAPQTSGEGERRPAAARIEGRVTESWADIARKLREPRAQSNAA